MIGPWCLVCFWRVCLVGGWLMWLTGVDHNRSAADDRLLGREFVEGLFAGRTAEADVDADRAFALFDGLPNS